MNVTDEIIKDMNLARNILSTENYSIVIVHDEKILSYKKEDGIKPILELIDELGDEIIGTVVGERILGKASAFLCRYSKVGGVYSSKATKTAIAILIIGGIPCQADELIPFIKDIKSNYLSTIEKMLQNIESPEEAYNILRDNVIMD